MKITILTIGTRGDVQPYIALGLGLKAVGHEVTIATLVEFQSLVDDYGLNHATLRGDFLKAAQAAGGRGISLKLIQQWTEMARDTLADEWNTARHAEALIYNPAALGGFHIAQKLDIPAFAAFPTPLYSPTREFPSPFFPVDTLGPFNRLSHILLIKAGPALYRRPIAAWRRVVLGLPPLKGAERLNGKPVPMLYGYSESVVPRPKDWNDTTIVTGYWFLNAPEMWRPAQELVEFLQSGPPPVYVGFGSMFMEGGVKKTEIVLKALKLAGQRGVLATGWGGLTSVNTTENIFVLEAAPHDWLFPKMAAVVHHGGAGTTGAALRAGKPSVICPLVGDQPFWGRRVETLGAGPPAIPKTNLTAERLAEAITIAVADGDMCRRAAALGKTIRAEDGVGRAVVYINQHLNH